MDDRRRIESALANTSYLNICPLEGDASTRKYYRIFLPHGYTRLAMVMPNMGAGEEDAFIEIQNFLSKLMLPTPEVLEHHPELGIVILQDLGDDLLEKAASRNSLQQLMSLYQRAIEILIYIREATGEVTDGCRAFELEFDETKLMEELNFFVDHFIKGLCKLDTDSGMSELSELFNRLVTIIASEPKVFTHRDYHSRNLILYHGNLYMIDFQDARMGPAQYDLASLLRDSYLELPDNLIDKLLLYYMDGVGCPQSERERFIHIFDLMSLQRNIKALGTFGYQTIVRSTSRYLSSIPRTGAYIKKTLEKHPELRMYKGVVDDLIVGPALQFKGACDIT